MLDWLIKYVPLTRTNEFFRVEQICKSFRFCFFLVKAFSVRIFVIANDFFFIFYTQKLLACQWMVPQISWNIYWTVVTFHVNETNLNLVCSVAIMHEAKSMRALLRSFFLLFIFALTSLLNQLCWYRNNFVMVSYNFLTNSISAN